MPDGSVSGMPSNANSFAVTSTGPVGAVVVERMSAEAASVGVVVGAGHRQRGDEEDAEDAQRADDGCC